MIDKALKFIAEELNNYLLTKLSFSDSKKIVLDNIAKLSENGGGGSTNKVVLSLVNIEEDRLSKSPDNFFKTDDNKVVYKNAPIHLNLYCLFAYNHGSDSETTNHYEEALLYISYVIRFFQYRNVFTASNSPAMDTGIEKLLMELHTVGFEQLNHLWAVLGGKYLPSVLYKMRLVVIDENLQSGVGELVRNVNVVDN
jgi:hypothetical protein